jgi:hypothetical protein
VAVGAFLVQEEEVVGLVSQYLLGHRIRLHCRRETLIWLVRELLVPQEQRLCLEWG